VKEGMFLETTYIWSKFFLIGSLTMIAVAHFLSLTTAESSSDVGPFLCRQGKFSIFMPLIFNLRLVLTTVLLFVYLSFSSQILPLSLIMLLQIGYLIYLLLSHPHKRRIDFFRAIFIEVGINYIFVMRYLETAIFD
jgi:hypothetical protein